MWYFITYVQAGWYYSSELIFGTQKKLNRQVMLIEQDGHSVVFNIVKSFTLRGILKKMTIVYGYIIQNIKNYISC